MESSILIASHLGFLVVGALIAGWTAWLFRTDAARGAAVREQTGRRLALLEEVAFQLTTTHDLLESSTNARQRGSAGRDDLSRGQQKLDAALEDMPLAEARLRLLDEVALCKALRLYAQKAAGFRRRFLSGSPQNRDDEALRKALTEIQTIHEKLHGSLARRYNRKQS